MKKFKGIVIHCSDSAFGNAQTIEDWHKERGFDDIGYNAVVCNGWIAKGVYADFMDGESEIGRNWDIQGAHARGYNDYFGLCLIGISEFSDKQFEKVVKICRYIIKEYGVSIENIIGHNECDNNGGKPCPNFYVSELRRVLWSKEEVLHG